MVEMHNVSMGRINVTTGLLKTWLEKLSLKLTNMKINGAVQLKNTLKSTDKKSTVHWTKTKLISFGMVSILALTNSYNMDVTSIPSHQRLRNLT